MSKRTIAIVEDDHLLALVLTKHLEGLGFLTRSFSRADAFLDFMTEDPELFAVLLDVKLKGEQNGISLARKIKRDVPLIFCTGNSEVEKEVSDLEANVLGILIKPVVMDELTHLLNSIPTKQ